MDAVAEDSVELVVTSPPYPMIEMWDETFISMEPDIEGALESADGSRAFELMHQQLDAVWDELSRVLEPGGIACINVGDATRSVGDDFQVYSNHTRIITAMEATGFVSLPGILWRKPTNSAAKFMGSGMLPPNAYPTLEHEHILLFRNGTSARSFPPGDERRYESAFFWEERNAWFTDVWTDVTGADQELTTVDDRDRSAAYPLTIPYRLINMFSVYEDTVLDPFWGTGTTTAAAMLAGRNSIGFELSEQLVESFEDRIETLPDYSRTVLEDRIDAHREFVGSTRAEGGAVQYDARHYDFSVKTRQEREILFRTIDSIEATDGGFVVGYDRFDG